MMHEFTFFIFVSYLACHAVRTISRDAEERHFEFIHCGHQEVFRSAPRTSSEQHPYYTGGQLKRVTLRRITWNNRERDRRPMFCKVLRATAKPEKIGDSIPERSI